MKMPGNPALNIKNYAFHIPHFELHLAEIKDKTGNWHVGRVLDPPQDSNPFITGVNPAASSTQV